MQPSSPGKYRQCFAGSGSGKASELPNMEIMLPAIPLKLARAARVNPLAIAQGSGQSDESGFQLLRILRWLRPVLLILL